MTRSSRLISLLARSDSCRATNRPYRKLGVQRVENRALLATLIVDNSDLVACAVPGDNRYCEIQEAVDAATPGDIIQVAAGTYAPVVINTDDITIEEALPNSNPVIDAAFFSEGVRINADGVTLQGLQVQNGQRGFQVIGQHNTLQQNSASSNGVDGFFISGDTNTLRDNIASENVTGFHIGAGSRSTLVGNTASDNREVGFLFGTFSAQLMITGNTASDNGTDGFSLLNSSYSGFIRNTAYGNDSHGYLLSGSNNNTFIDNTAQDNEGNGFFLTFSDENAFIGNSAISNVVNGFRLSGSNVNGFIDNIAQDNEGNGFFLTASSDNTFGSNTAHDNRANGISLSSSDRNYFVGNTASSNDSVGLLLTNGSSDNFFIGNTASHNPVYGMSLLDSDHNTFADNTASDNGIDGIRLVRSDSNALIASMANGNGGFGIAVIDSFVNFFDRNECVGNGAGESNVPGVCGNVDPGFPYVDANNDGYFDTSDGDVPLTDGELDDGFFDTSIPELPGYPKPIVGAALSIHGAPISNTYLDFSADGRVTVDTDLTATNKNILLRSRTDGVFLDDATLHARNLLEITAGIFIISTNDVLRASGSESVIRLDAGQNIQLIGTPVTAMREVDMDAGSSISISPSAANPATVTATPNIYGKVDLRAVDQIDVTGSHVDAIRDIIIDSGGELAAVASQLTANSYGPGRIDLQAADAVYLLAAQVNARNQIVIESENSVVGADFATVEAAAVGASTVEIEAAGAVFAGKSTLSAAALVHVSAGTDIVTNNAAVTAGPNFSGRVEMHAPSGSIGLINATINATKEIDIDASGDLFGNLSVMNAKGHSRGTIDLDAGGNLLLERASLNAREKIDLEAADSIFAAGSKLLAQGSVLSQIRAIAGVDLILNDAVIRARDLIDLVAADVADLTRSSIGITHLGPGDLCVTASTIDVSDAVLRAPDQLALLGTIVGIPDDISIGFLPSVSC